MATEHDREILNSIFHPLLPTGDLVFEENIPEDLRGESEDASSPETDRAKAFEVEGVKAAEEGNLDLALNLFSKSVEAAPTRPSGYNNRAQAYRLLGKTSEAMVDLNNALNLSAGKGRAACQAYCQRGLLNLKENQTEDAKSDFQEAANLGSQFAKAQLVQMNPYAALCNKMLRTVIGKLQRGENEEYDKDEK